MKPASNTSRLRGTSASSQTGLALLVLLLSLPMAVGGALVARNAYAMRPPEEPERRTLSGTVVDMIVAQCGPRNSRRECYRPVVDYIDDGQQKQAVSRGSHRPAPLAKGQRVQVFVEADGSEWLAFEWEVRQNNRQRDFQSTRSGRLTMGWLIAGCGAFGLLLALGLMFFVDRGDENTSHELAPTKR